MIREVKRDLPGMILLIQKYMHVGYKFAVNSFVCHVRQSTRPYTCQDRQFAQLYTRLLFIRIAQ